MRCKRADGALQAPTSQSEQALGRCRFAVSTGSLRVQPAGPRLSSEDTARLLGQLRGWQARGDLKEVVFDLSQIETIGPQWTVVLALLIGFARSIKARCRIVSLHGQPAAVVGLYRRNRDVALLVEVQKTPGDAAEERSCHVAVELVKSGPQLRHGAISSVV